MRSPPPPNRLHSCFFYFLPPRGVFTSLLFAENPRRGLALVPRESSARTFVCVPCVFLSRVLLRVPLACASCVRLLRGALQELISRTIRRPPTDQAPGGSDSEVTSKVEDRRHRRLRGSIPRSSPRTFASLQHVRDSIYKEWMTYQQASARVLDRIRLNNRRRNHLVANPDDAVTQGPP